MRPAAKAQARLVSDTRASANPLPALGGLSLSRRRLSRYDGGDDVETLAALDSDSELRILRFRLIDANSVAGGAAKTACWACGWSTREGGPIACAAELTRAK